MARARRIQIRGEQWRIVIGGRMPVTKAAGYCDPNTRTIHIRQRITRFEYTLCEVNQRKAILHEVLHSLFPDIEERVIEEAEDALDAALDLLS
jgi:hypothetical protein